MLWRGHATTGVVDGCEIVEGGNEAVDMTVSLRHRSHILWEQFPHSASPIEKSVLHSWHAPVVGSVVTGWGSSALLRFLAADSSAVRLTGYLVHSPQRWCWQAEQTLSRPNVFLHWWQICLTLIRGFFSTRWACAGTWSCQVVDSNLKLYFANRASAYCCRTLSSTEPCLWNRVGSILKMSALIFKMLTSTYISSTGVSSSSTSITSEIAIVFASASTTGWSRTVLSSFTTCVWGAWTVCEGPCLVISGAVIGCSSNVDVCCGWAVRWLDTTADAGTIVDVLPAVVFLLLPDLNTVFIFAKNRLMPFFCFGAAADCSMVDVRVVGNNQKLDEQLVSNLHLDYLQRRSIYLLNCLKDLCFVTSWCRLNGSKWYQVLGRKIPNFVLRLRLFENVETVFKQCYHRCLSRYSCWVGCRDFERS